MEGLAGLASESLPTFIFATSNENLIPCIPHRKCALDFGSLWWLWLLHQTRSSELCTVLQIDVSQQCIPSETTGVIFKDVAPSKSPGTKVIFKELRMKLVALQKSLTY